MISPSDIVVQAHCSWVTEKERLFCLFSAPAMEAAQSFYLLSPALLYSGLRLILEGLDEFSLS